MTTAVPETATGPLSVALNVALAPTEASLAVIVFKGPVRMAAGFVTVPVSTVWGCGVVGLAEPFAVFVWSWERGSREGGMRGGGRRRKRNFHESL